MSVKETASLLSLCVSVSFLVCVSGDPEQIEAKPGEDVPLQCRGSKDATIVMLRWVRPDLKGSEGYVFYFTDNSINEKYQHESFRGRVDLRDPEMKDGDFSVILKNVRISDTGSYECYVGTNGNRPKLINNISLKVQYPGQRTITAEPGQNVTLTCRAPSSSEILAVEWTRPDLDPDYVILYRDGRPDPENQHPSFKERVELKDSQMKDGDVSVTLKDVTFKDTGTYECHLAQSQTKRRKRGVLKTEPISIVHLRVSTGHGHVGLAVGLTVVGILLLVAAVVGFMFYRKRSRPTDQNPNPPPEQTPMNPK